MSRSYTSSPPQAPPWRVEGLLFNSERTFGKRNILEVLRLTLYYTNVFLMLVLTTIYNRQLLLFFDFNHVRLLYS
jgi:hypothetical protein